MASSGLKPEAQTLAANILAASVSIAATTGASTLITIPAGRTWVGTVTVQCNCAEDAAGTVQPTAIAIIKTAGTGVVPAAGTYLQCDSIGGANAAGGTVGNSNSAFNSMPMTVVAPAGNSVTITYQTTNAGSNSDCQIAAFGILQ